MPEDRVLTPELMYRAAAVVAVLVVLLAAALSRRVGTEGLRRARGAVALASGVFWLAVWSAMVTFFWAPVYSHVFPAWARWGIPPVYAAGFAALALLWRALALRANRWAVAAWVALWGATGALTHAYAILSRGLLSKTPMLQHLTPASAVVFATCEFGVYGCVILGAATLLRRANDGRGMAGA